MFRVCPISSRNAVRQWLSKFLPSKPKVLHLCPQISEVQKYYKDQKSTIYHYENNFKSFNLQ